MVDKDIIEKILNDDEEAKLTNPTEVLNQIQSMVVDCPVKIFNVKDFDLHTLLGTYLMTMQPKEITDTLKAIVTIDKLNNDSVLFFTDRHLMELTAVLYGMFTPVILYGQMAERQILIRIIELINKIKNPIMYIDFKQIIDKWLTALKLTDGMEEVFCVLFKPVLEYIWFVPYSGLDKIMNQAKEKYNVTEDTNGGDSETDQ